MGSLHGNCKIREQKPPIVKTGLTKTLESDINKLFEAVNLRTTKSLDLSDIGRNASKKPMRATGSHSPAIGFSDPVSLKQALRGLCVSQAAEMAALKRSSMPASPRTSFNNIYRSPAFVEYAPSSSRILPWNPSSASTSASQSLNSSPRFGVKPVIRNLVHKSVDYVYPLDERNNVGNSPMETDKDLNISEPKKDVSTSLKVRDKSPVKLRRKSRFQTVSPSTRSTPHSVKPVVRSKNLNLKKPKKVAVTTDENSNGVNSVEDHSSEQLICKKCQCSLRETSKDASKDADVSKPNSDWVNRDTDVVKTMMNSKGNISQSSSSSICEFSSSTTTSLSDESNLSSSSCNNRPHMSKDVRWEAINHIRKKYGFLGLNHFNLIRKLGSGDIGTVYLSELTGTNCLFALKVMDNEFLAQRKKIPRAQTEREILRMLDHPFLPTLYAQFNSDNLSCLVMEFCPGGDLHVLRQKQPGRYFPEQDARFYVAEVLLALEYLHMLGIVYRDLKPENILVREDGHIMLTDFDLSLRCSVNPTLVKSSTSALEPYRISGTCAGSNFIDPFCNAPSCQVSCFTPRISPTMQLKADAANKARLLPQLVAEPTEARSNSFVGTHEYLAPEIITGEGHGSSVDWWTLGVFLYELLYGKTPFKGAGNEETLANVVLQNLKFPHTPIVSFQAWDLIRGLLVKEPENRLGTKTGAAEIKRHPFFEGLNWALIRCAVPPEIPELYEGGTVNPAGKSFIECGGDGDHLEFELF